MSEPRLAGFLAGTCSGAAKLVVGQPFDIVKVRCQAVALGTASPLGPWTVLTTLLKREGVLALYKGASPPALGWAISDSLLMGTRDNVLRLRKRSHAGRSLTLSDHILAGSVAGLTVCLVVTPIEHLKAKLQVQVSPDRSKREFQGLRDVAVKVWRHGGVQAFYRGFVATLVFRVWFGAYFGFYDIWTRQAQAWRDSNTLSLSDGSISFLGGGLASMVFWSASFPFDTVKNRIMADSILAPRYTTWRQTVATTYRQGGLRQFYRGFFPCLLRAFPANASAIWVWEFVMRHVK